MPACLSFQSGLSAAWRRIPKPAKAAFVAAFVSGVLTYLYALTHPMLCVGDAFNNVISQANQVSLGRWSSMWLCSLSTDYSMPVINGGIMILCISAMAALTVVLLDVKSTVTAVLCGMVLMCYPAVGDTLKYTHNADGYMLASMLAVLALLLTDRLKWGLAAGIPLLTLALGTYQANMSLVLALMTVRAITLLTEPGRDSRQLIGYIWRYAVLAAASLALYYLMAQLVSSRSGIPFSDYQSVNSMGDMTPETIARNFLGCYVDFKKQITFLSFRNSFYFNGYANYMLTAIAAGLAALNGIMLKERTPFRLIMLGVLLALLPFLLCSIRIFNPSTVHSLMKYSVVGIYLMALTMSERIPELVSAFGGRDLFRKTTRLLLRIASWILLLCLLVCLYAWVVGINLDYFQSDLDFQNMHAQCAAYLYMAESTEGYTRGMPIYVIGTAGSSERISRETAMLKEPMYIYAFMKFFLDVDMPFGIANEIDAAAYGFAQTEVFASMPCYPSEGCTIISDGALYLKLSELQ